MEDINRKVAFVPVALLLLQVFVLWTLLGMLMKIPFMCLYNDIICEASFADKINVLWNGLRLDMAIAGYLSLLPGLMLTVSIFWKGKLLRWIWNGYFFIIAEIVAFLYILNIGLYGYWGFPLDSTPLFYISSSFTDAVASVTLFEGVIGFVSLQAVAFLTVYCFYMIGNRMISCSYLCRIKTKLFHFLLSVILLLALFIPIRGGFGTGVNNTGSVYFSKNIRLNHAAVNPVFSMLESLIHEQNFANMYRFMPDEEADGLFSTMVYTTLREDSLTNYRIENTSGTKVVVVILESFSSYIMTEAGHVKGVTPTLDSLAKSSVYFTNFYANSFRTDRGLVSILSGFPAQPNMSLMKYPHKTRNLYSIAKSLKENGFNSVYVYGGDANFTNMRSYVMGTGFNKLISDTDFSWELRSGKWGVNDGNLFDKAIDEMDKNWKPDTKDFLVVQTSSSHEPYDVPCKKFDDKIFNAFYYTDRELGRFIQRVKKRSDWSKTLLVIVPDHLGCWPDPEDNYKLRRYHIPLFLTGGVIDKPERIETYGSQQDIAATVLGMLGIDHSDFIYSKDLFDSNAPHFAFFTHPDAVGIATSDNQLMQENVSNSILFDLGKEKGKNQRQAQAYLQKLFDDIASR